MRKLEKTILFQVDFGASPLTLTGSDIKPMSEIRQKYFFYAQVTHQTKY